MPRVSPVSTSTAAPSPPCHAAARRAPAGPDSDGRGALGRVADRGENLARLGQALRLLARRERAAGSLDT